MAAFAATIVYLAGFRTVSAFILLPDDGLISRYKSGNTKTAPQAEGLERVIASRTRALGWIRSSKTLGDRGFAQMLLAGLQSEPKKLSLDLLREAKNSFEAGLAVAPLDPHAWTQLAYAKFLLGDEDAAVKEALKMSLLTGPYEPKLVFPRLRLLLNYWSGKLPVEERKPVYTQIRFAWEVSRDKLVILAAPLNLDQVNAFRVALAFDPRFLLSFERRLKWARINTQREINKKSN